MKTVEFWEITAPGGISGSPRPTGRFLATQELAFRYTRENPGHDYLRRSITICDSFEDLKQVEEDQARKAALTKLTPAERKVLGLED